MQTRRHSFFAGAVFAFGLVCLQLTLAAAQPATTDTPAESVDPAAQALYTQLQQWLPKDLNGQPWLLQVTPLDPEMARFAPQDQLENFPTFVVLPHGDSLILGDMGATHLFLQISKRGVKVANPLLGQSQPLDLQKLAAEFTKPLPPFKPDDDLCAPGRVGPAMRDLITVLWLTAAAPKDGDAPLAPTLAAAKLTGVAADCLVAQTKLHANATLTVALAKDGKTRELRADQKLVLGVKRVDDPKMSNQIKRDSAMVTAMFVASVTQTAPTLDKILAVVEKTCPPAWTDVTYAAGTAADKLAPTTAATLAGKPFQRVTGNVANKPALIETLDASTVMKMLQPLLVSSEPNRTCLWSTQLAPSGGQGYLRLSLRHEAKEDEELYYFPRGQSWCLHVKMPFDTPCRLLVVDLDTLCSGGMVSEQYRNFEAHSLSSSLRLVASAENMFELKNDAYAGSLREMGSGMPDTASKYGSEGIDTLLAAADSLENNGDRFEHPVHGYRLMLLQGDGDKPTAWRQKQVDGRWRLSHFAVIARPDKPFPHALQYLLTEDGTLYEQEDPGKGDYLCTAAPIDPLKAGWKLSESTGWSDVKTNEKWILINIQRLLEAQATFHANNKYFASGLRQLAKLGYTDPSLAMAAEPCNGNGDVFHESMCGYRVMMLQGPTGKPKGWVKGNFKSGGGALTHWALIARPHRGKQTGTRQFLLDDSGKLWSKLDTNDGKYLCTECPPDPGAAGWTAMEFPENEFAH